MYKIFGKMRSDKHGFTIVELMVVLALMGLVAALIGQLFSSIWKKYRMVEQLYIIQSEVQAIMSAFQADAGSGSLATATNVDLFYEDQEALKTDKTFTSCAELGTFQENDDGSLFFPKRAENTSEAMDNKVYTYLFVYNDYFYVLNGGTDTAYRFKFTDEAKISIKYEVSVDAFKKNDNNEEGDTRSDGSGHKYLPGGITVTVESAPEYDFHYELHTSFSLKNTLDDKDELNMNNGRIYGLTNEYVAGYTNGELPNFPNVTDTTGGKGIYVGESGKTYPYLQEAATVIKYISLYDFNYSAPTGGNGSMNVGAGCGISFLMVGSSVGEGVKNTLRSFRDNVLRDNALGEIIIDKYYNLWSPVIIEMANESPALKKVLIYAVESIAYLMEMVK